MTTTADTDARAELEVAYCEALADETLGGHGRAVAIASEPLLRGHIVSVSRDREAVACVRKLIRGNASATRLSELQNLRDKADAKRAKAEAALADAQRDADAAKRDHEQLVDSIYKVGKQIEMTQHVLTMNSHARRAIADEVKAAGIDI